MPRSARLDAPGVLHHVMGRGIERKRIFWNNDDRKDFLERLAKLAFSDVMDIYAWVLMPNHFHILCKTKNLPLSSSMRKILTGYVINFNGRHKRRGHLFQNRYKSIVCQEDIYLKELVRYIHLNLSRAGLVKDLNQLNRNPWPGHSALVSKVDRPWQDTRYVLSFFGSPKNSRKNYLTYVEKGINQGHRPDRWIEPGLPRTYRKPVETATTSAITEKPTGKRKTVNGISQRLTVTKKIPGIYAFQWMLGFRVMKIHEFWGLFFLLNNFPLVSGAFLGSMFLAKKPRLLEKTEFLRKPCPRNQRNRAKTHHTLLKG